MSHFTCDRANCPKWKEKSSSKSSSIDEFDKADLVNRETQMSNSTIRESSSDRTFAAPKNPEKPSEANFDRNHQNIKCQINCSSNSSQTNPSHPNQMSALMVNSISSNVNKPRNPVSNAAITPQRAMSPREKCTCQVAEVPFSSSSTSIVSEHFPVRSKMPQKEMPKARYLPPSNRTIVITCMTPRPARLQPAKDVPCTCREQYFSCNSEDSEADETVTFNKSQYASSVTKLNKTEAILQLLQEIITLLNTNVTKSEQTLKNSPNAAASSTIQDICSEIPPTAPESEMNLPPPPPEPEPECIPQEQVTVPNWCPCFCFAQGMAMATGQPPIMPCMQPINKQAAALYPQPVPTPFVCEGTEDSFKDCFSSSVASAMAKDADFVCAQITSVVEEEEPCICRESEKLVPDIGEGIEQDEEIKSLIAVSSSFDHHKCYGPGLDSLEQYEDEEPTPKYDEEIRPIIGVETPIAPSAAVDADVEPIQDVEKGPETDKIYAPEKPEQPAPEVAEGEKDLETDKNVESEQPAPEEAEAEGEKDLETDKDVEPEQTAPETIDQEMTQETDNNVELEQSATAPTDGSVTDADQSNEKQLIRYVESEEEESYYPYEESEIFDGDSELAKEKFAESYKQKETPQDEGDENHLQEMKFFIDSLIMDLEAMDYARRRAECEKKLCKPKPSICCRESFPVTITEVEDLSSTSLYVKWIIHDCCGIGGYEIYTDGYLTNRFYHAKHEAAVITNVDITMPHKISLVAQPSTQEDCIELICDIGNDKTARKSLPWKTNMDVERKALYTLWTPSVYLYSPPTC